MEWIKGKYVKEVHEDIRARVAARMLRYELLPGRKKDDVGVPKPNLVDFVLTVVPFGLALGVAAAHSLLVHPSPPDSFISCASLPLSDVDLKPKKGIKIYFQQEQFARPDLNTIAVQLSNDEFIDTRSFSVSQRILGPIIVINNKIDSRMRVVVFEGIQNANMLNGRSVKPTVMAESPLDAETCAAA